MGWSDLGWAMENLWAVSMGRQFFVCPRLGHQTKTHVNYILYKDINNKSKKNYRSKLSNANDAIEASTLFYATTTRSGRLTANTTKWRTAQYRNW